MTVGVSAGSLSTHQLLDLFRRMHQIRQFDARALELFREGLVRGSTHPYIGTEAVAVGACAALRDDDFITSTHRGHGHCIAKGGDLNKMMAELLGRATGYCRGKGGSMHIADLDRGILGANGIVGGGMGIAAGSALSAVLRGTDQVTICFFGDGALNQGALHESSNMAAIWKLPVIFLCENNHYAMSSPMERMTSVPDPSVRAAAYGFPGVAVDGMDVLAVYDSVRSAVERAREGRGPTMIVADTYRYFGHHVGDPLNYRSREEVEEKRKNDPIDRFQRVLVERGILTDADADRIQQEVVAEVERSIDFAKASPEPSPESLMEDIYA